MWNIEYKYNVSIMLYVIIISSFTHFASDTRCNIGNSSIWDVQKGLIMVAEHMKPFHYCLLTNPMVCFIIFFTINYSTKIKTLTLTSFFHCLSTILHPSYLFCWWMIFAYQSKQWTKHGIDTGNGVWSGKWKMCLPCCGYHYLQQCFSTLKR